MTRATGKKPTCAHCGEAGTLITGLAPDHTALITLGSSTVGSRP